MAIPARCGNGSASLFGRLGGRGAAVVTAVLLAAPLLCGTARAGDDWEFWPELNGFVNLDPRARLHLAAAYARGKDSYNQALDTAGYLDVSFKPPARRSLRQKDWARNRYLWARVGYVHVFKAEGGVPSPGEDRGVAAIYARAYLPAGMVFEGRGRTDFRWIDGKYSERYRLRGEVNREFTLRDHPVTPYLQVEWFYDTRFDGWSRILFQVGPEVTVNKRFRFEVYLARQEDHLPQEYPLNAFGIVAKLYY